MRTARSMRRSLFCWCWRWRSCWPASRAGQRRRPPAASPASSPTNRAPCCRASRSKSPTSRPARRAPRSPARTASTPCRCCSPAATRSRRTLIGFKTFVRDGVTVTVESTARVDMKLGGRRRSRRASRSRPTRRSSRPSNATLGIVDRREEDRRAAAERPQLHAARHAAARRRRAAGGARRRRRRRDARRLRRRDVGLQRQRHAQPVEQLPARRREQQRHLQHRLRAAPAAGRDSGVQDPDALLHAPNTAATPARSSTS